MRKFFLPLANQVVLANGKRNGTRLPLIAVGFSDEQHLDAPLNAAAPCDDCLIADTVGRETVCADTCCGTGRIAPETLTVDGGSDITCTA